MAQRSQVADDIDHTFIYTHGFIYETWSNSTAKNILHRMEASPLPYVAEIDRRIAFPTDKNLTHYPGLIAEQNWQGLLGLLSSLGEHNIARADILAVFSRVNSEITEDIDLMQKELTTNTHADPSLLKRALLEAEFLYNTLLQNCAILGEPLLLKDAIGRYESQTPFVQRAIREYSIQVTGTFPPSEIPEGINR